MGVLYRGIDPVLDREVAIKLMLSDFSDDAEQMRPRFYREARAAARLQHRNIVTVFEFAEEANTPFMVMEFLRGASLAQRIASGPPLTLDEKLDIVAQLCAGLNYAHEQGVIHRDVKPANIFLMTDGTVKLLDFGIAKMTASTLTRQGDVVGSASYMSPEQVSGSDTIDGRADIFSTGVVLYELLAGRKPFQGEVPTAIVMKILQEAPPPIEQFAPGLPAQLVTAVNRALEKDPEKRFATAGDLGRELQWIRKALQASNDAAAVQDETQFANTSMLRGLQEQLAYGHTPVPKTGTSKAVAVVEPAPTRGAPPAWAIGAAIAAVAVVAVAVGAMTWRRGDPSPAAATSTPSAASRAAPSAAPGSPAAAAAQGAPLATPAVLSTAAPGATATVGIDSDPPGAHIVLDGRDTRQVTPASLAVGGAGPHRVRLSKTGFQSAEFRVTDADLRRGPLRYTLKPAEAAMVPVAITGPYPFEVFDGARPLSGASDSHELNVPAGKTLRLVAPEFMLNAPVRVEGTPGQRVELQAPGLGRLTVLTKYETCSVRIGTRDLGYPPINNQAIAAGSYTINLVCPDGANHTGNVAVIAGQLATARIF